MNSNTEKVIRIDWYIIILHNDQVFRSLTVPPQDIIDKSSCVLSPGNYPIPVKGSLDVFSDNYPLLETKSTTTDKTVQVKCKWCHQEFTARVADRKRGWAQCCSKSCAAKLSNKKTGKYTLKHDDDDEAYLVEDGSWDAHKGYF